MRKIETYQWWPDLVAAKDELSLRDLAERFAVTPGAISAALRRNGIQRRPIPPGPRAQRRGEPRATTSPRGGDLAWRVDLRTSGGMVSKVVIGRDLLDAARRVSAICRGEIVGLVLVGELIDAAAGAQAPDRPSLAGPSTTGGR